MGLIRNAISSAFESFGGAMMDVGELMLSAGYNIWKGSGSIAIQYAQKDPMTVSNAYRNRGCGYSDRASGCNADRFVEKVRAESCRGDRDGKRSNY